MSVQHIGFDYQLFNDISLLAKADRDLLTLARETTGKAYAPYSRFHVGAAALLTGGKTIAATNQENASYPVGICAERVLLSAISSVHPDRSVASIAISYDNKVTGTSPLPLFPCGICRQTLLEYELRQKHPIRLILGGQSGHIIIIDQCSSLLPFGFSGDALLG